MEPYSALAVVLSLGMEPYVPLGSGCSLKYSALAIVLSLGMEPYSALAIVLSLGMEPYSALAVVLSLGIHGDVPRVQELCESRGGRPGLPSLINLQFLWT